MNREDRESYLAATTDETSESALLSIKDDCNIGSVAAANCKVSTSCAVATGISSSVM